MGNNFAFNIEKARFCTKCLLYVLKNYAKYCIVWIWFVAETRTGTRTAKKSLQFHNTVENRPHSCLFAIERENLGTKNVLVFYVWIGQD